ncbi:lipopolysaccharide biosynthesis protein [Terriglobus saanensis]|uniref:lipopolysaccharide biosynthesis protein n=1 Tax=Terriglobus saanensis TaxID=870903 RepID=UPI00165169C9|nr:lipopolysaccharide biosynthesis protein [Terriglobus saanensis]
MPNLQESLTTTTGRALGWNYIGSVVKMVLSFGINTLLSRLLGPRPFGELAVAMIVFGFGSLLSNVGLSSALLQKEDLAEGDIRFCFTCQMAFGILMTTLLFCGAPILSRFFHEPKLMLLLRVCSLLFVLQAFGTTALALLNRRQDARSVQAIAILSYVVGYPLVGLSLALMGAGVWSLVAAWLTQSFLYSVLVFLRQPHSIKPLFHPDHLPLLHFGIRVFGANVCRWGISNLDNTVVGRVAGPLALGLYSRAFTTLGNTTETITSSLLGVLLPAFSRVQTDEEKLRRVYASVFGLLLLVILPMFAAVAAAADVVVLGLYGKMWANAVPYMRPIALAMAVNAVMSLSEPLLIARGKPQIDFGAQLIVAVLAVAGYVIAIRYSVLALSWTVLGLYLFRFFLLTTAVHREIRIRWTDLMETSTPGLLLALFAAAVSKGLELLLPPMPDFLRLVCVGGGAAILVLGAFSLFSKTLLRPMLRRSPQLLHLFPARIQQFLDFK